MDVHIVPIGDLIGHLWAGCPCGPRTNVVLRDDGTTALLVTHHSLDNREADERAGVVDSPGWQCVEVDRCR